VRYVVGFLSLSVDLECSLYNPCAYVFKVKEPESAYLILNKANESEYYHNEVQLIIHKIMAHKAMIKVIT